MSRTNTTYEEIVVERGWDMESQIALFLQYAEAYQLTDHFFAFLQTKPVASPKHQISSSQYPLMQLVQMVIKNKEISGYINDNALVNQQDNPWSMDEIAKCIRNVFSIELDMNDSRLLQELQTYFNYRHSMMKGAIHNPNQAEKSEDDGYLQLLRDSYIDKNKASHQAQDGDSYFDSLFSRYASISSGK